MYPPLYFQREYFETDYFWPDWAVYITVRTDWLNADPYAVIEVEERIKSAMLIERPIIGWDFVSSTGVFVPVEHIVVIEGNSDAHVTYGANASVNISQVNPYTDTFVDEPNAEID